jgi:transposase
MLRELRKVEQRYDAVLAVIRDGMRVIEVAEKFGVHRDTVHTWRPTSRPTVSKASRTDRTGPRPRRCRCQR